MGPEVDCKAGNGWQKRAPLILLTYATVDRDHCPGPGEEVEDVDITPVSDQNRPARMSYRRHEVEIQDEDRIDECLDVGEILGESQGVDVHLEAEDAEKCPVEALRKEL